MRAVVPWLPSCHRPPNRFLRYYKRPFDDKHGHTGVETIVVYLDKNGTEREEQYSIKWDDM